MHPAGVPANGMLPPGSYSRHPAGSYQGQRPLSSVMSDCLRIPNSCISDQGRAGSVGLGSPLGSLDPEGYPTDFGLPRPNSTQPGHQRSFANPNYHPGLGQSSTLPHHFTTQYPPHAHHQHPPMMLAPSGTLPNRSTLDAMALWQFSQNGQALMQGGPGPIIRPTAVRMLPDEKYPEVQMGQMGQPQSLPPIPMTSMPYIYSQPVQREPFQSLGVMTGVSPQVPPKPATSQQPPIYSTVNKRIPKIVEEPETESKVETKTSYASVPVSSSLAPLAEQEDAVTVTTASSLVSSNSDRESGDDHKGQSPPQIDTQSIENDALLPDEPDKPVFEDRPVASKQQAGESEEQNMASVQSVSVENGDEDDEATSESVGLTSSSLASGNPATAAESDSGNPEDSSKIYQELDDAFTSLDQEMSSM